MKKLKVYTIMDFDSKHEQRRAVVAAYNRNEAAKALGCTLYYFNKFGSITGNDGDIKIALENPGKKIFRGKV